jgi:hypothetical protein
MWNAPTPTLTQSSWRKVLVASVGLGLVLSVLLLAFTWPSRTTEPRNLPVTVAGPEQAVGAIAEEMESSGTFDVVLAADRDEAVRHVVSRETYGAVVLGEPGQAPEVLTATAAGAAPATILNGLAAQVQAQVSAQAQAAGTEPSVVVVTDLVSLSTDDATGGGLGAASFPMAMGGVLGGVLASLLLLGTRQRLVGVAVYSAVGGLLATLVLNAWFGYLPGPFALSWLAAGAAIAATAYLVSGLHALVGRPGLAAGAILTMLVANPLASPGGPWQFLAEPWGAIGQFMVPGAGATLLRTVSYFPDASSAQQWWTLAAWTLVGIALHLVAAARSRSTSASPPAVAAV